MRRISLQWIFMMHFERKVAEFAPSKTLQKAIDRIWSLFEFGGFACVFDLWLEDYRALDRYANSAPSTITIWMKVLKAPKIPFLVERALTINIRHSKLFSAYLNHLFIRVHFLNGLLSRSFITVKMYPMLFIEWIQRGKIFFCSTNICHLSRVVFVNWQHHILYPAAFWKAKATHLVSVKNSVTKC